MILGITINQNKKAWETKVNAHEMGTEYSGLRYKTVARTGGFAACTQKEAIIHLSK